MNNDYNCHGCKWLDENRKGPKGAGYCCMIERSEGSDRNKARRPESKHCELYCEGDFATRWDKEETG